MGTTFDFVLTPELFSKAVKHNNQRLNRALPLRWVVKITLLVAWLALVLLFSGALGEISATTSFFVALAIVVAMTLIVFWRRRGFEQLYRRKNHLAGVPCRLTIEETGLRHRSPGWESFTEWSRLSAIDEIEDVLLLRLNDVYFLPLPASAFGSKEEKDSFISHVRSKIGVAAHEAAETTETSAPGLAIETTSTVAAVPHARQPASMFLTNFANGFRLAFLRRVDEARIPVAWWQVAAFGLASVVVPVLYDVASIGLGGEFEWWAIPSAIAHVPIILLAAIVSAYVLGNSGKTLLLLQILLMIAAAIDLAVYATYFAATTLYARHLPRLVSEAYSILLPAFWLAVAYARAATSLSFASKTRAALGYAACVALLSLPLTQTYWDRHLWHKATQNQESDSASGYTGLNEDAFYEQPRILERELAGVRPGRRGVIDVYFVGVGGYVYQDVFMKEVEAVSAIFRERFGSEGKVVRLVNNRKSAARLPIASVTGIGAALNRVGRVMDKDEDILFLFLTSHGSETHRFSLDFWPLKLKELDPAKLRALLDESGIRNRVVVVSACYSGGFIGPLQNENTLVISASAADKTSFGCSNEAEWTYFGKAYFDEALRKTFSFVEAFEMAKPVIAEREKKDGHKPSDPQMALGEVLKPKLLTLQRQLTQRQEKR